MKWRHDDEGTSVLTQKAWRKMFWTTGCKSNSWCSADRNLFHFHAKWGEGVWVRGNEEVDRLIGMVTAMGGKAWIELIAEHTQRSWANPRFKQQFWIWNHEQTAGFRLLEHNIKRGMARQDSYTEDWLIKTELVSSVIKHWIGAMCNKDDPLTNYPVSFWQLAAIMLSFYSGC